MTNDEYKELVKKIEEVGITWREVYSELRGWIEKFGGLAAEIQRPFYKKTDFWIDFIAKLIIALLLLGILMRGGTLKVGDALDVQLNGQPAKNEIKAP